MRNLFLLLAGAAALAAAPSPADAQATSVATANPTLAIARSQAFETARQQIQTSFASNLTQLETQQQARQQALQGIDTDGNQQVTDAELQAAQSANTDAFQRYQAIEQQINQLQLPLLRAETYVIEQINAQVGSGIEAVATQRGIGAIVSPESLIYASDAADITDALVARLNQAVPAVAITPPAEWNPRRDTLAIRQQLMQLQQYAAYAQLMQQRQQQQGQTQPQPQGR